MSNQQITVHGQNHGFNDEQWRLLTDFIMKGANQNEVSVFAQVCKKTNLDPFRKQIHAVKRWNNDEKREVWSYQTGIDGYLAIAHRTGLCAGIDDVKFIPEDESAKHPTKATVTVWKVVGGVKHPFTASARWDEYVQTKRDGEPNSMWRKMPYGQLGKCATALALRKAFPEELGGVYTDVEMDQADNEPPPPEQKPQPKTGSAPEFKKERNVTPPDASEQPEPSTEADRAATVEQFIENDAWRDVIVPDGYGHASGMAFGDVKRSQRDELRMKATGDFRDVADASVIAEIIFIFGSMKMQPPANVRAMANMDRAKLFKLLDGARKQYKESIEETKEETKTKAQA